jgi:hypothetical protein
VRQQQIVLFTAGTTPLQMRLHTGKKRLGIGPGKLELDVSVEHGKALFTVQLRPAGPRMRASHAGIARRLFQPIIIG